MCVVLHVSNEYLLFYLSWEASSGFNKTGSRKIYRRPRLVKETKGLNYEKNNELNKKTFQLF